MALRLAGEEYSVVQGLDGQGWPREISANDANPALEINQSGGGSIIELKADGSLVLKSPKSGAIELSRDVAFQQATTISTTTGDLTLSPAGDIAIGANLLKTTNLGIKEEDSNNWALRNAADTGYKHLMLSVVKFEEAEFRASGGTIKAQVKLKIRTIAL